MIKEDLYQNGRKKNTMNKKLVIDRRRVGTKGWPLHWKELGLEPPMKEEDEDD